MSPAVADLLPVRLGQLSPDPAPTFGDPQLHRAALVVILVPHGRRVSGARAAGLRAAPVTWRLQPGRVLPGAASRADRAPAPPPGSPPRAA
jgi:hypothetical protein